MQLTSVRLNLGYRGLQRGTSCAVERKQWGVLHSFGDVHPVFGNFFNRLVCPTSPSNLPHYGIERRIFGKGQDVLVSVRILLPWGCLLLVVKEPVSIGDARGGDSANLRRI